MTTIQHDKQDQILTAATTADTIEHTKFCCF